MSMIVNFTINSMFLAKEGEFRTLIIPGFTRKEGKKVRFERVDREQHKVTKKS